MKYFCVSDIHSHYTPLKKALDEAGFDANDESHSLIVCGDVFDRGSETMEVYRFLKSIPEDRLILIRGNHELLYEDLLDRDYPYDYDFSNGTVRTFCAIAGVDETDEAEMSVGGLMRLRDGLTFEAALREVRSTWSKVRDAVVRSEVTEFLRGDRWRWYFDAAGHTFVHAFVPTKFKAIDDPEFDDFAQMFGIGTEGFDPAWREADDARWERAVWKCPWKAFKNGFWSEDRVLVTGHWYTSAYFSALDGVKEGKDDCPLYISDRLVGLDACTYFTDRVNVYVIEG